MNSATSTKTTDFHGTTRSGDDGFKVSHFFVLLALIAATIAVVLARPAAPENLILISLTIGAAGLAAVAFYRTIAPFIAAPSAEGREQLSAGLRAALEREKGLTLRSIKELEFDRAMGKVSEEDFQQMAGLLRARAIGIMKQLYAGSSIYRPEIEKELASRLGDATRPDEKVMPAAETKKVPIAASDVQDRQSPLCSCGTTNDPDARFCKSCGARLTERRT